jgi:peptide deformylase
MPDAWIRQWGDPTLRLTAPEVQTVDDILRAQVARMQRLLVQAGGAGLAATQVGLLRRVFVYRLDPDAPPDALINPRIVSASPDRATFHEGCLSFNTVTVVVERAAGVQIEALDPQGDTRVLELEGFGASLMQHEIDHLDGVLTLDRATPHERRRAIRALSTEPRGALAA